jgi:hypothetical protein
MESYVFFLDQLEKMQKGLSCEWDEDEFTWWSDAMGDLKTLKPSEYIMGDVNTDMAQLSNPDFEPTSFACAGDGSLLDDDEDDGDDDDGDDDEDDDKVE